MPDPAAPPGLSLYASRLADGRWYCVASAPHPRSGQKVMLAFGIGDSAFEAVADCHNDLPAAIREFWREFGESAGG